MFAFPYEKLSLGDEAVNAFVYGLITLYLLKFYLFFDNRTPRFSWRYYFLRVYGAFFDVYDYIITHKCRRQKKVWPLVSIFADCMRYEYETMITWIHEQRVKNITYTQLQDFFDTLTFLRVQAVVLFFCGHLSIV